MVTPEVTCMATSAPERPQTPPHPLRARPVLLASPTLHFLNQPSSAPSNLPSPLLPQDLCPGCSLSLRCSSLIFLHNWCVSFRSQPNGTSSEKPSLNSQPQPSLAEALSICPRKCCAAFSPNPHIQPLLQTAFLHPRQSDRLPIRYRPPSTQTRGITEVWTLKPACWGSNPASATY